MRKYNTIKRMLRRTQPVDNISYKDIPVQNDTELSIQREKKLAELKKAKNREMKYIF